MIFLMTLISPPKPLVGGTIEEELSIEILAIGLI